MRRGIGHLRAGGFWSPALLFSSGAQGTWFDPADFSTLYQDSAGTTPVTATGQPVGKILDKSGRGNHATQATATSRPTLQQDASGYYYLLFDGVDDKLVTGSAVGLNAPAFHAFYAVLTADTSTTQAIFSNSRYGWQQAAGGASRFTAWAVKDYDTPGVFTNGATKVIDAYFDASFNATTRVNGVAQTTITGTADGSATEGALTIGATWPGRLYGGVFVKSNLTAVQVSQVERFLAQRCGVSL